MFKAYFRIGSWTIGIRDRRYYNNKWNINFSKYGCSFAPTPGPMQGIETLDGASNAYYCEMVLMILYMDFWKYEFNFRDIYRLAVNNDLGNKIAQEYIITIYGHVYSISVICPDKMEIALKRSISCINAAINA